MFDVNLKDYLKMESDKSDSERIQRAIDDCPNSVLYIPKGNYQIAKPLFIKNRCSIEMHPQARLIASEEMDYVLTYDGNGNFSELTLYNDDGSIYDNLNLFIRGGDIDGNGKASCLIIANSHHFTLCNISLHNGKKYGLSIGGYIGGRLYELVANNVYCKTTMKGLGGNVGIYSNECDGHFTDCFVIDYTKGFVLDGGANRLTRCHIWGGTVPPINMSFKEWSVYYGQNKQKLLEGKYDEALDKEIIAKGLPEMLKDSVAFEINSGINVLDGCFADTAAIGYKVNGDNNVITNSGFFNNKLMGLRNALAIENNRYGLIVSNCFFVNATGTDTIYKGEKDRVTWANNSIDEKAVFSDYYIQKPDTK